MTKLWSAKWQNRQCLALVLLEKCARLRLSAQYFHCIIEKRRDKLRYKKIISEILVVYNSATIFWIYITITCCKADINIFIPFFATGSCFISKNLKLAKRKESIIRGYDSWLKRWAYSIASCTKLFKPFILDCCLVSQENTVSKKALQFEVCRFINTQIVLKIPFQI